MKSRLFIDIAESRHQAAKAGRMPAASAAPPFGKALIRWYCRRARPLPWRSTRDPYRIWVSEIMLQQTRVETVIPYYLRFLGRYPSLRSLANARLETVLRIWEGLGYYSRARHLHRAARQAVAEYGDHLPQRAAEWEKLPGVGRYTAAAIAAIAFEEPTVALDANARRILARVCLYRRTVRDARADRVLAFRFAQVRGAAAPGAFFQALMELGQTVCLPRQPQCKDCPISKSCFAYRRGLQERLPIKTKSAAIPHADVTAAVILQDGKVLLARRPAGKILAGMWEFPGGKRERGESLETCLRRELREELGVRVRVREKILSVRHEFTHLRITLHVFRCDPPLEEPIPIGVSAVRQVRIRDLAKYPMGKADRIVAKQLARL